MRFLAFIGLLMTLLVTSCTTNVVVEGTIPTPLVKTLPVTVGVYYDENFKTFRHTEALEAEGTWNVDIGQQNLTFFRNLMGSMFENVVELDSPEVSKAQMAELDGVVIPRIEKYGFLTPGISGLKFFSASIHYRLTLIDKNNKVRLR